MKKAQFKRSQVAPEVMIERKIGEWKLITDVGLLAKLKSLRVAGLPEETVGVLLGTWDLVNRVVLCGRYDPGATRQQEAGNLIHPRM